MPTSHPRDVIALFGATATGAGPSIGLGGVGIRYAQNVGPNNRNGYPVAFKFRVGMQDSSTGATASVAVQTSPDNSVWTTIYTFATTVLVIGSQLKISQAKLFKVSTTTGPLWVRANVLSITGGTTPTLNAYLTPGTYGI